jgi:hypothetical protein
MSTSCQHDVGMLQHCLSKKMIAAVARIWEAVTNSIPICGAPPLPPVSLSVRAGPQVKHDFRAMSDEELGAFFRGLPCSRAAEQRNELPPPHKLCASGRGPHPSI